MVPENLRMVCLPPGTYQPEKGRFEGVSVLHTVVSSLVRPSLRGIPPMKKRYLVGGIAVVIAGYFFLHRGSKDEAPQVAVKGEGRNAQVQVDLQQQRDGNVSIPDVKPIKVAKAEYVNPNKI